MRTLKTSKGCYKIDRIDGEDRYTPITLEDYNKLLAAKAMKQSMIKATASGAAMVGGAAVAEAGLASAAGAAEIVGAAVGAAELAAAIPTIVTVATIGGIAYGGYRLFKWATQADNVISEPAVRSASYSGGKQVRF